LNQTVQSKEWNIVTTSKLIAFAVGVGLFAVLVFCSEPGFVFIVDHANLLFHEAGHPFVGLFSERLEPYGGTLGQLTFPAVLAISFWRKEEPVPVAVSAIWFFENFLNIGRYMADARALELPLLGGGDHDWNTIFSRWHVLQHDVQIGSTVKTLGWLGMLAACAWVGWRAWQDRKRPVPQTDSAFPVLP
jgi:hypothetical protein